MYKEYFQPMPFWLNGGNSDAKSGGRKKMPRVARRPQKAASPKLKCPAYTNSLNERGYFLSAD
jgi:hypothetical protein